MLSFIELCYFFTKNLDRSKSAIQYMQMDEHFARNMKTLLVLKFDTLTIFVQKLLLTRDFLNFLYCLFWCLLRYSAIVTR